MVYHPGSGLIILFGGGPEWDAYPETLWAYDASAGTWANLDPDGRFPYGCRGHAMVYDSKSGAIVLFGGESDEHGEFDPEVYEGDYDRTGSFGTTWLLTP